MERLKDGAVIGSKMGNYFRKLSIVMDLLMACSVSGRKTVD